MKLPNIKNVKGFTLIELLVVIGILAILLSIVLIAINPARQFGQANDTKRRSAVTQVLNAIGAYAADNKGQLPAGIPATTAREIGSLNTADVTSADCAAYTTGYTVVKDATTTPRVTVSATGEITTDISITR